MAVQMSRAVSFMESQMYPGLGMLARSGMLRFSSLSAGDHSMTDHHGRNRQTAMWMLEESLKRLKTDHLELWQVHDFLK